MKKVNLSTVVGTRDGFLISITCMWLFLFCLLFVVVAFVVVFVNCNPEDKR